MKIARVIIQYSEGARRERRAKGTVKDFGDSFIDGCSD